MFLNGGAERLTHDIYALRYVSTYLHPRSLLRNAAAGNHKDFPRAVLYLIYAGVQRSDHVCDGTFDVDVAIPVTGWVGENPADTGGRAAR